jgi:hypothetical protein
VLGKTEITIPAWNENHVICEILPLYLKLLHDDNIGLKSIEHGSECPVLAPWLVAERVANAVDIPSCNSKNHLEHVDMGIAFVVTFSGTAIYPAL